MKRTNQVQSMVNAMNERLKYYHIKNEDDPGFSVLAWLLMQIDIYEGFEYHTKTGTLCGPHSDKLDYIQLI